MSRIISLNKGDLDELPDAELVVDEEFSLFSVETINHIKNICAHLQVKNQLRNPHQLVTEHKEETIYRKTRDKVLKRASFSSSEYWKVKSEHRENKPILPIKISDSNINRAYRILDTMISTLEEMEGRTRVSSDQGKELIRYYFLTVGA